MKKLILTTALTLLTSIPAMADAQGLNCESFETIQLRNCELTYYSQSDETWSLTLPMDTEKTYEKIGTGRNAIIRESRTTYDTTNIHDYAVMGKLTSFDATNNTVSSKWIKCSGSTITSHIEEVVTSENKELKTFYIYRFVLKVNKGKAEIKQYRTGKYLLVKIGLMSEEIDAFNGRPQLKVSCDLY